MGTVSADLRHFWLPSCGVADVRLRGKSLSLEYDLSRSLCRPKSDTSLNSGMSRLRLHLDIACRVALIQLLVGQQTGTAAHQWSHRDKDILPNFEGDPTQLDCIDEAVNTWTYLTLMERGGLLHFHRVAKLSHAGTPIDPRNTAVLQEIGGQYFAIDPALVDVGMPPPIIPLDSWIAHWPPDLPASEAPVRLRVSPKLATASNNGL